MKSLTAFTFVFLTAAAAFAGEFDQKIIAPAEIDDRWQFALAAPGFMAGIDGNVGIDGAISKVGIGFFDDILPQIDMIWVTRAEASKGRFGIMGELIYLSMSDSLISKTVVKKVDVQVDEYLADFSLRWRLVEGERGFVDALIGVRYTNLYQVVDLHANDARIEEVAGNFTEKIGRNLRGEIEEALSEGGFRTALKATVRNRLSDEIERLTGPENREANTPNAPLASRQTNRIGGLIERLVNRRKEMLIANAKAELRQAAAAEAAVRQQTIASRRDLLLAKAAKLRGRVNDRISDAKKELKNDIKKVLTSNLDRRFSRADDWWDPYIGIRARYNFNQSIYVVGRGDIGGFGVGSDLMWQAEGALGIQLTRSIYTELGYRALSFDYENDGLTYDVITHGAQWTIGVQF